MVSVHSLLLCINPKGEYLKTDLESVYLLILLCLLQKTIRIGREVSPWLFSSAS